MTQPGETDGFTASRHIKALTQHSHARVIDYCIVNTGKIPGDILKRYESENAYPVSNDRKVIENMGYRVIEDDTVSLESDMVRHDPLKLAKIILGFMDEI